MATIRLADILHLGKTEAQLDCGVTVCFLRTGGHHPHLVEVQNSDGDVAPVILEKPRHAQLLGDHSGAHRGGLSRLRS
jgi:hypothetical protein